MTKPNNKTLSILGSTGSIGTQALEICTAHSFHVCGLVAYSNVQLLARQARTVIPEKVCIVDKRQYLPLKALLRGTGIEILAGVDGMCEIAVMEQADMVLNAVVGMVGLKPTLAAIKAGKDIALANKETLVAGGKLVMESAQKHGVRMLPVDSEHSAILQAMQGCDPAQVKKVILTASGGPFYGKTRRELNSVTIEQALAHPNWNMGAKITVDSATLMNKGLEFIEAMWLFALAPEQLEVVIHRESIVHSAVEMVDHSILAQLGTPDMKLPIQYALTYPQRTVCPVESLSLIACEKLTFASPDWDTFVCLDACIRAAKQGGLMPVIANAAGEMATALFLAGKISFLQIGDLVCTALASFQNAHNFTLDDIINTDQAVREFVRSQCRQ